jgi:predicted amidophosphoribosyltransferase
VESPISPRPDVTRAASEQFEIQRNWLLNVRPPSREVCPVCRGARDAGYPTCFPCRDAYRRSGGLLASAVVPISYSPDNGQHYHQLKVYKSPTSPNRLAQLRLAVLYATFFSAHRPCLERVAGGALTHVATVPSTRQRPGVHPLDRVTGIVHGALPSVVATADPKYGNAREFRTDRFRVAPFPTDQRPARVLLVEDLWVTGARAQSMAHALREAGAAAVVVVALGRHVNHAHPPSRPLLRAAPFDLRRCALDDLAG